ncbi:MAG: DAHL domain-containing protein [Cyanobacteria bacterium P01_H01_bin.21]
MGWADFRETWRRTILSKTRQLPLWFSEYLLPAGVVLLFLLLWAKSQTVNPERHSQYVNALRQLQELDARINQDLLQIKLGLLNNYDPIVDKQAKIEDLQQLLASSPSTVSFERDVLQAQVQEHRQLWQRKNDLIQDFKTDHAVLRNSLAYFPIAIADISRASTTSPTLAADLNALLRDLLLFNMSATKVNLPPLEDDIKRLRNRARSGETNLANVLAHSDLILKKRPATNRLAELILAVPTRKQGTLLAETYDMAYQQAVRTANIYRIGLYTLITTLVMVVATSIISRLRAAAIAQQQSENTQQALINAMPDFMLRMYRNSPRYDVVSTGQSVILSEPQIMHGNLYDDLPLDIVQRRLAVVEHVLETGVIEIYEQQLERAGQPVWEEVRVVPCGKDNVLVMIRNICDRKQTEANLQRASRDAQVANQAKSQFLSNMSHELRTPLNVILGYAQLMDRNRSLNPQQQSYLDSINQSGEHLLSLINDVLEMSKIEAGKATLNLNDFDLHGLLNGIYTMFQFKANANGVQLHLETVNNLPQYIHTDENKLRQVLINLVGNAVKFTHAGHIYLRVAVTSTDDTLLIDGSTAISLEFEVEDTGLGIVAADLDHLFDPFNQASNHVLQQEGTGLGLPISKKFVEMMGGTIDVSSQVGRGSQFTFSIQVKVAQTAPVTGARSVLSLTPGQPTYRILVVEDMPKNRQLLNDLLSLVGFEVKAACDGLEATEICQRWHPHLVWMDLRMPVMDGYQATQRIKASEYSPVIIALTGSAFEQERHLALDAGCDDFVSKPFRTETIFEKMTTFLGVRYLYQEPEPAAHIVSIPTTATDLQVMPAEWIERLHQAATRVNGKEIYRLLAEIPPEHRRLANYLGQLVDNFHFEAIISRINK